MKTPQGNSRSGTTNTCQHHFQVEALTPSEVPTSERALLSVSVIASAEAFRRLRDQWNRLLDRSYSNCIFLTWEWLFTWWKWYANRGRLFILVLRDASGRMRGIAPLMTTRSMAVFQRLQLLGSDSKVCSDYLDVIAETGWEKAVTQTLVQFLSGRRLRWHSLVLSSIPGDSPFLAVLRRLPEIARLRIHYAVKNVAPSVSYPETCDKLLAGFGYKTRRNIRYYRRRIEKGFHVEFAHWSALFDRRQTISEMNRLQRTSISRKGFRGIFEDKTYRNFHADVINLFNKKGWLYIMFLLCDGKPVAFQYAYLYAGRCYGYQRGFDTDYSSYRIGTVLQSYVFEDTLNRGFHAYDCLRGNEDYKYLYANSVREMLDLTIFSDSWSAALLCLILTWKRRIKSRIADLLGKNLRQKIKAIAEAFRVPKKKTGIA